MKPETTDPRTHTARSVHTHTHAHTRARAHHSLGIALLVPTEVQMCGHRQLLLVLSSSLFPFPLPSFFPLMSLILSTVSLWTDSPSALILLCTVLLQMRQARRLSNPCIQRYTSRIGECSSTYVSSSKSPLFQAIS